MKRGYIVFIVAFLMTGCEEKNPVYTGFDTNVTTFECLNVAMSPQSYLYQQIAKTLTFKDNKNCPYKLTGYVYRTDMCTNAHVKALGADFDGYVYLQIEKNGTRYYRAQSDFKDDMDGAVKRIVTKLNTLVKK